MTPVLQSIHGRTGDCFRACIASLLDLPPGNVPHFYEGLLREGISAVTSETQAEMQAWFGKQGLYLWDFAFAGEGYMTVLETVSGLHPDVHFILAGRSPRNWDSDHAIVCRNGRIVHDPAGMPSLGFTGPQKSGYYHVIIIGKLV